MIDLTVRIAADEAGALVMAGLTRASFRMVRADGKFYLKDRTWTDDPTQAMTWQTARGVQDFIDSDYNDDAGLHVEAALEAAQSPRATAVPRDGLVPGLGLVATYKGQTHHAEVIATGGGKVAVRVGDAVYASLSQAGSAVTGTSVNGWKFWQVER